MANILRTLTKMIFSEQDEGDIATPDTGQVSIFVDSVTKKLASKDDSGAVTNYGAGGGGGGGDVTPYRIAVSVSSNSLTVALKNKDGNDPSMENPVKIQIGDTVREVTSVLSVTIPAGTNWFNLGSAELGTLEHDLFVNLVWVSGSSTVAMAPSRVARDGNVSNYSSTTTNQNHLYGYSGFTSTDPVQCIGRFAATLSFAGTGHLWTVPTFNGENLIHRPIYKTRWNKWSPQASGSGSMTISSLEVYMAVYQFDRDTAMLSVDFSCTTGGTGSFAIRLTVPFTINTTKFPAAVYLPCYINNGSADSGYIRYTIASFDGLEFLLRTEAAWSTGTLRRGRGTLFYAI